MASNELKSIAGGFYVINLAHRTDRRQSVTEELREIGLDGYEFFDAYGVNHLPPERYTKGIRNFEMSGWWGNKFSHYGVIEAARDLGLKSVMVMEDDVSFHPQFNEIVSLAIAQLNEGMDWDWLQFGGNHRFFGGITETQSPIDGTRYIYVRDGLVRVSDNLGRILKMLTAHAYIVRERAYDFILKHAIESPLSIDGFYAYEVHNRFNCYCVMPCVAKQIPGMNDIGNCYSDYRDYIGD